MNPRLATDNRSKAPACVDYRAGAALCSLILTALFTLVLVGMFTIYTPDRLVLAMLGESLKGSEWLHLAGIGMFLGLVFLFGGASWLTLNRLFARLARAPR